MHAVGEVLLICYSIMFRVLFFVASTRESAWWADSRVYVYDWVWKSRLTELYQSVENRKKNEKITSPIDETVFGPE